MELVAPSPCGECWTACGLTSRPLRDVQIQKFEEFLETHADLCAHAERGLQRVCPLVPGSEPRGPRTSRVRSPWPI